MSLAQANKNLKLDSRLTERNISVGDLTQAELEKHLASLPDLSSNVDTFTIDKKSNDDEDSL